jgi:hypothetical protein
MVTLRANLPQSLRRQTASFLADANGVKSMLGARRVTRLLRAITLAEPLAVRNSNLQFNVRFQLLSPCRREIAVQPKPTKMLRFNPMCTPPGNASYLAVAKIARRSFLLDFSGAGDLGDLAVSLS